MFSAAESNSLITSTLVSGHPPDKTIRYPIIVSSIVVQLIATLFGGTRIYGKYRILTETVSYGLYFGFIGNFLLCCFKDPGIIQRNSQDDHNRDDLMGQSSLDLNRDNRDDILDDPEKGVNNLGAELPNQNINSTNLKSVEIDPETKERKIVSIYTIRECETCNIMKPALASHCKFCNNCVKGFDQYFIVY